MQQAQRKKTEWQLVYLGVCIEKRLTQSAEKKFTSKYYANVMYNERENSDKLKVCDAETVYCVGAIERKPQV